MTTASSLPDSETAIDRTLASGGTRSRESRAGDAAPGVSRISYQVPAWARLPLAGMAYATNVRPSAAADTLVKVRPLGGAMVATVFPVYVSATARPSAAPFLPSAVTAV